MPCLVTERKLQTPQTKQSMLRGEKGCFEGVRSRSNISKFFKSFLKFDIRHVTPLRIEISFFRRMHIYEYTTWIYIYVRQISLGFVFV